MKYGILRFSVLALIASLYCAACAVRAPPRYVSSQHAAPKVLAVWLDPKAGLPPDDTLAGCNYWNEMDVRCVLTANVVEADIVIVSDDHPCAPNEKGRSEVAFASPARVISVRLDCYYDTARVEGFDAEQYRSVIAHEVGHEIGIWDHVPLECDDKAEKAKPEAMRRCGQAIMNPVYDPKVSYLTFADAVAFAQRDRGFTVVPRRSCTDGRICVLYARKK
jgi:hypothetical protein